MTNNRCKAGQKQRKTKRQGQAKESDQEGIVTGGQPVS